MIQSKLEQPYLATELWRAFFENTSVGITIADLEGRFVATNSAYQRMLGYSEGELAKLSYMEITVEEDRNANLQLLAELAAGVGHSMQLEKRYRRKDGTIIWVNVSGNVIPGASEGSMYLASIVQEITERKHAESALRESHAELAHVTRVTALGELAASIAHEINQPLGAIIADANACLNWLAADRPDLVNVRESLGAIVNDGERAAQVLTRIRALLARSDVAHEPCDLTGIIHEVISLVGSDLARQAIAIQTVLPPVLPNVQVDRIQIQQVLLNLLLNAAEASKDLAPERRRVRVCVSLEDLDEGRCVVVAVQDAGIGLQGQRPERVFEPFYTTKPNGLGMGLSISHSIVDSHGGRLWAASNEDHGATFRFALPILQ
jgi:PAS domain S-box-containing protein